jgi:hypothetical protein
MDAATRRSVIITLVLTLVVLGFAAMSTSPPFAVPSWLPIAFFIAAFGVMVWLLVSLVHSRRRRKNIVSRLGMFYLEGEDIRSRFRKRDPEEDVIALATKWSQSVVTYFRENPDELGDARLISLSPRQSDWFVYGHFNPFGENEGQDEERRYAFQHISIEMEKLADLMGELLR